MKQNGKKRKRNRKEKVTETKTLNDEHITHKKGEKIEQHLCMSRIGRDLKQSTRLGSMEKIESAVE